jgi:5-methylcytosine-specific restriction endonuclease McrA
MPADDEAGQDMRLWNQGVRMRSLEARCATVATACAFLQRGEEDMARDVLKRDYPHAPEPPVRRRKDQLGCTRVFIRDGFIDRYSGERLVFTPALRVLSTALPEVFPYHPNWKTDVTHVAYWDLCATVDHLVPVSHGGADDETNWVTTSQVLNSAKGNWTLEDLRWTLHAPGDFQEWDGLLPWFVEYTDAYPAAADRAGVKGWRTIAVKALASAT